MQRVPQPASSPVAVGASDAVLTASRAMVGMAIRSVAGQDQVTVTQHRALVVLAQQGPQSVGAMATHLGVNPSTVTRLVARLVRAGLVSRHRSRSDHREVQVSITARGRDIVDAVTARRRVDIEGVLARLSPEQQAALVDALGAFAQAAEEIPEQAWAVGWPV